MKTTKQYLTNHDYLNCKQITTAINRATTGLLNKASREGVYENFGQVEVRSIKDKFIDTSDYSENMNNNRDELFMFSHWCSGYQG